ncbi:MAG: hypothetical protein UHG68_07490, partial [Clostridia bacterium]|nr:hypothetical protein [Clostridia bacterium]
TINGGTFKGDVYAVSRAGNNLNGEAVMNGKITMIVNGGTFNGNIIAVQEDKTVSVTGECSIQIIESLKNKASGFSN